MHSKWASINNGQVDAFLAYFKSFNEDKPGWYEGYSIGDPSQSNAIESSHKHIKVFEDIKSRTPCIKFMKGKGRNMIEEQSKLRSPTFIRSDGCVIDNPNQKIYKDKPEILTIDWSNALKWDGKKLKMIQYYKDGNVYCTSDSDKKLDRSKCKAYFEYIGNIHNESDFDRLITKTDELKVIKFNQEVWENSECSCRWWHKYL